MLIIIGKFLDADGKVEACRILETDTKETGDFSLKKIKDAMKANNSIHVKGLKLTEKEGIKRDRVLLVVKEKEMKFNFSKVPELKGSGDVARPEEERKITLVGWTGFSEMKKYHCVDYKGHVEVMDIAEFTKRVKANEVNGANYNPKTHRAVICNDLNIEL